MQVMNKLGGSQVFGSFNDWKNTIEIKQCY